MKKVFFLLLFSITISLNAQTKPKSFFELSTPIKMWVLFHPFKAKKSYRIALETNKVSDSIAKTNALDKDKSGGQVDAFRHAYWLARLKQDLGEKAARSLGEAHEKDNYITFKKTKLEDGIVPDEISSEMDLHNNEQGLQLIEKNAKTSRKTLIYKIINAIKSGKMRIIKKDKKGNFLTCSGNIISKQSLKGKWKNNKCLVNSNL
ncbi:hypothetical protein [uncultured Polaribacter sp.]|uniref:DUF6973 domain-containing protein n=1 Tax=uncultured Polaribacter sp. TaxID=174711 RepID=UPI00261E27CD|nr:hypothetical protein [uncultured Polaribacter sp.]